MTEVVLREATDRDIAELAKHCRAGDRDEIMAATGRAPLEPLLESLGMAGEVWAGRVDNELVAVYGLAPSSILTREWVVWMIATDAIHRHQMTFLRTSRRIVAEWRRRGTLLNFTDARNTVAHRWLRWLGAKVYPPVPYGPFSMPFHPFEFESYV